MTLVYNIRNGLIFGNVWISLCAVAQGMLTFRLIEQPVSIPVVCILFLATFFIYNLRLIADKEWINRHTQEGTALHLKWMAQNSKSLLVFSLLALAAIVPFSFFLDIKTLAMFALTAILALAYSSMPLFMLNTKGLRQIPGMKTILIGTVWAFSTVVVPIVESGVSLPLSQVFVLSIKRFIVVFVLALLFDLRDEKTDRVHRLQTIVTYWGAKNSKVLCLFLLLVDLLLMYAYDFPLNPFLFFGLLFFLAITALVVVCATDKRSVFYYVWIVDGMMVVQYAVISVVLSF